MSLPEVVVVGASGFGREALDVLVAMRDAGAEVEIAGVVDDGPSPLNRKRLAERGVAYLGTTRDLLSGPRERSFVLGVGSPPVRQALANACEAAGLLPFTAVHPAATIGTRCRLGAGTVICAGVQVSTNVSLGRHVHLNPASVIGHDSVLADFVSVNPSATISGEVTVGTRTLVGAGAVVLQNLSIGADTVVGAAALVTKDVPAGVVVTGIPGRWREVVGER